ncbi:MAG TPA: glycosyltransferase, partial [Opitutaceae bacterium]|nr:glycosyltransferase [Opitutaceae bacterium]
CGALPARLTRLAGLGSLGPRAWLHLRGAGARLLRREHFDLVFFSTTQFLTFTLGAAWKKKFSTPFIVDVQDPWRTDYYERPGSPPPPGGWKYRFARWQAEHFEEASFRPAAGFVSVSENYLDQLRGRYPWFADKPSVVIPFGVSEADFAGVQNDASITPAFRWEPGCVHLVSMGAAGSIMSGTLHALFSALRIFRDEQPALAARLRLHFIGTSYAPAAQAAPTVQPLAEAHGVGDLVNEQPARISYPESLKTMLAADALLLLGSDDPGYTPSKIAPYFFAGRPVLAFVPAGSAAEARVAELRFARVVSLPTADTRETQDFFSALITDPARLQAGPRNQTLFDAEFTARAGTRRLCNFFDQALAAQATIHD